MKIVINSCYGGFGLSKEAEDAIAGKCSHEIIENGIRYDQHSYDYNQTRSCPVLVDIVERLGVKANGRFADLTIVTIPDDVQWEIDDYDGVESIHEKHRSWF